LPKDLNKIRDDPTANPAVRNLASTLKNLTQNTAAFNLPVDQWRKEAKTLTVGGRTHMSLREQRESLPIFKLRTDLIKAIFDNRILVVIGETGSGKTTQMP